MRIYTRRTSYRNGEYEEYKSYTRNLPIQEYFPDGGLKKAGEVYDEITEINTRFIVSMSSEEITLRDHPVVGTRIHMASNGIEQHQTLVGYEPMEMIAEKIARAVIQKQ